MQHVCLIKQDLCVAKHSLSIFQTGPQSRKERPLSPPNRASVSTKQGICIMFNFTTHNLYTVMSQPYQNGPNCSKLLTIYYLVLYRKILSDSIISQKFISDNWTLPTLTQTAAYTRCYCCVHRVQPFYDCTPV